MTLLIGHQRKRPLEGATPFDGMLMVGGFSRVWVVALGPLVQLGLGGLHGTGLCHPHWPAPWAEERQAGASEERPAAPPLEGAGTARAACLACSPRAFLRIPIYNQKMNTDTVILYPFLVRGVVKTFERNMVEDKKKKNPSYSSVTLGPLRCESSLT